MAAASPTPMPTSYGSLSRRPSIRQLPRSQASRPNLKRGSPLSLVTTVNGVPGPVPVARPISVGDSSDDEIPAPMKFSALTKALLNDEASAIEVSSPVATRENNGDDAPARAREQSVAAERVHGSFPPKYSPSRLQTESPIPRRIVRLSAGSTGSATLRRTTSGGNGFQRSPLSREKSLNELITPAPRPRSVRITGTLSNSGACPGNSFNKQGSGGQISPEEEDEVPSLQDTGVRPQTGEINGSIHRYGSTTVGRIRQGEDTGVHGSLRVKRVGKVTGTFLSGPARRGGRRRQSEEDQSPLQENQDGAGEGADIREDDHGIATANEVKEETPALHAPVDLLSDQYTLPERPHIVRFATGSPERNKERARPFDPSSPPPRIGQPAVTRLSQPLSTSSQMSNTEAEPIFKVPALPPALPSTHDQENEPPPTFKRSRPQVEKVHKISVLSDNKMLGNTPTTATPKRTALAPRSQNTPHRPAPPPPKMSVLETATATAGAATVSYSKKKRNYVSVNNKIFTRMDLIGRGGSARVYRVMAENHKIFALKKVTLEDVDELTIRGYKGEIDLLSKLENVDRVVRLFDWEVNEEKQTLSVLMEMGESDLNRILTLRLNADNAKYDISFTRHYWREMLSCVSAVHAHDIVHSDLKPANFLLVQGRLKLIDFGIANAIQDDTINVHREQTVGTPNYMSPEAIVDSNAKTGLPASTAGGKCMKLGKPSDVWSLGCILYQMVYGRPPFAHIPNQIQRIMAIPNPNHHIEYPATGVGGATVPSGLIRTLKRCLDRDQLKRPTVEQLLDENDSFLFPDNKRENEPTLQISQELLGNILANVVKHCDQKGIPNQEELALWPANFFARIRRWEEERV
ncbi:MAG: Dual-specificity kinase, spindle pole body (SPB) duplication and spindle checkpoint function [Pycnora praestabilis]|nr:MAG: Dual-specificity kinase, spindle pole body (SPB) duplication and spindle checkpoint function [Pycnora praestabilis]